ncbi:MAG: hypothetical protein Q9220_007101 [cf. Caloplaca sp. 1 TL-2023]
MGTNTVNFVLDLIVLVLPMPYIKKLQVRQSQKMVVFGMFALGGFIVAVSIILLVVCYKLDNTSADITWTISPIVLWAGTEINLGVVTACLPSLRPIFLLIKTGSARPDDTAMKVTRQGNNTSGTYKSKITGTFLPRGRNATSFAAIDDEGDEHHPFSIASDEGSGHNGVGGEGKHHSGIRLEEVQPPQDRVHVREDIYVHYTNM